MSQVDLQEDLVADFIRKINGEDARTSLSFDSIRFPGIGLYFQKRDDNISELQVHRDTSRFAIADDSIPRNSGRSVEHLISFSIGLNGGPVEVRESVCLLLDGKPRSARSLTVSIRPGNFTVLQCLRSTSRGKYVIQLALRRNERLEASECSSPHNLSKARRESMILVQQKDAMRKMRIIHVRIPCHPWTSPYAENLFREFEQNLIKSSSCSAPAVPETIFIGQDNGLSVAPVDAGSTMDTRRVQGADFGPDFETLSTDEKMKTITKKIHDHADDHEHMKECWEMVKEFERAVELDEAAGPLGNGNVTSLIYRMVAREVPHEMVDLFLMLGKLKLQKGPDTTSRKRKWDLTGF